MFSLYEYFVSNDKANYTMNNRHVTDVQKIMYVISSGIGSVLQNEILWKFTIILVNPNVIA